MDPQTLLTGGGLIAIGSIITKVLDTYVIPRQTRKLDEAKHKREAEREKATWLRESRLKNLVELSRLACTHQLVMEPESHWRFQSLVAEARLFSTNPELKKDADAYLRRVNRFFNFDLPDARALAISPEVYYHILNRAEAELNVAATKLLDTLRKDLLQ